MSEGSVRRPESVQKPQILLVNHVPTQIHLTRNVIHIVVYICERLLSYE